MFIIILFHNNNSINYIDSMNLNYECLLNIIDY